MIVKLLLFGIWAFLVPLGTGLLFARSFSEIPLVFAAGYVTNWALFQVLAVPMILQNGRLFTLDKVYGILSLLAALAGIVTFFLRKKAEKRTAGSSPSSLRKTNGRAYTVGTDLLWILFFGTLVFQLYMSFTMAYADGDDAFYVAHSTASVLGGSMYRLNPYTGLGTAFEARHALAPFPMWAAFIALRCDVNAAVASHSLLPLALIPLTYAVYAQGAQLLFRDKKQGPAAFMLVISLLQIFGNYSIYPASTFLLTRSRQGKAALANVILPFLLILFLMLGEELKENGEAEKRTLILMALTQLAGCLTSTLSPVLTCIMAGVLTLFFAIAYKNRKILGQCFLTCLPAVCMVLLMLLKRGGM